MKASELIKLLQEEVDKGNDYPVLFHDYTYYDEFDGKDRGITDINVNQYDKTISVEDYSETGAGLI
jgi:hypothetical protein